MIYKYIHILCILLASYIIHFNVNPTLTRDCIYGFHFLLLLMLLLLCSIWNQNLFQKKSHIIYRDIYLYITTEIQGIKCSQDESCCIITLLCNGNSSSSICKWATGTSLKFKASKSNYGSEMYFANIFFVVVKIHLTNDQYIQSIYMIFFHWGCLGFKSWYNLKPLDIQILHMCPSFKSIFPSIKCKTISIMWFWTKYYENDISTTARTPSYYPLFPFPLSF